MHIPAYYFDGKTSRKLCVTLSVETGIATISGDAQRRCPIAELRVSERTRHTGRKVTFPDGAYLEILDGLAFNQLLSATGHRDSLVVRMQQCWRGVFAAGIAIVMVLAAGYLYGLPAASKAIVKALPQKMDRAVGRETLSLLDRRILSPSKLPSDKQKAIAARFTGLTLPEEGVPEYEILFRKSRIGPNAFALPSGQIVVTDELVGLVDSDDALMGILAHELGHLHERHIMQRIIQGSAIGAVATALFGDVSAVIANIPTVMLDMRYSRDAEREADDFAIAMLKANGIDLSGLITAFAKLETEGGGGSAPYLSSHPPASERIERIRRAQ